MPLIDATLDLDGCVLHGHGLHFSRSFNFKRHLFGRIVGAWGDQFAQGIGAWRKMLDAMRLVQGGPSVNFRAVGAVDGELGAFHFSLAGQVDFGDVDFGAVVGNVKVRFDYGRFLAGVRQLNGMSALVE